MPFLADWAENYALEWLKDNIAEWLPALINSQREYIAIMEQNHISLWANLPQDLRNRTLGRAYGFASTILALELDDVVDVVEECLNERGISVKRDWIELNLSDFRAELQQLI